VTPPDELLDLGDTTYVVALIAEFTYQQALLTRVQAQANRLSDMAALFQAPGGAVADQGLGGLQSTSQLRDLSVSCR
jgi:outer membrane protein TolC